MLSQEEMREIRKANTILFCRNWDGSTIGFVPKNNTRVESLAELEVILSEYNMTAISETEDHFLMLVPRKTPITVVMDAIDAIGDFRGAFEISQENPMLIVPATLGNDFALQ